MTGRASNSVTRLVGAAQIAVACLCTALAFAGVARADSISAPAEQVKIQVTADLAQEWDDADGHISILRGQCRVVQGSTVLAARQMVMWRITQSAPRGERAG